MNPIPRLRAETCHADLGAEFYDPVAPADFPQTVLRFRNDRWAERVGLGGLDEAEWIARFARFVPLPGSFPQPLALRYHGHQFRVYNPDLGDGRGFLYAQVRDIRDGRLLDFGTKGSGQTPWSRMGDGRLTLKGGMREVLASEMLEALGVYTSRSFSVIETGEALMRGDEPSPTRSCVLVRLSHSHIRVGTFQRLAAMRNHEALRRLVDHVRQYYWPEAEGVAGVYDAILGASARLAAEWFAAGFVHGVLNTDNLNITGESFDYGPWRFLDRFDPSFTAAYFDHGGLYCYARQPEAVNWTLARLGECLIPIASRDEIETVFDRYSERFNAALTAQTLGRLGVVGGDAGLVQAFWSAMQATRPPFQQVFHDLVGGAEVGRLADSPIAGTYANPAWAPVLAGLRALPPVPGLARALGLRAPKAETLVIDEVEAIWAAIDAADDWGPFAAKVAAIRRFGESNAALGLGSGPLGRPGYMALGTS